MTVRQSRLLTPPWAATSTDTSDLAEAGRRRGRSIRDAVRRKSDEKARRQFRASLAGKFEVRTEPGQP